MDFLDILFPKKCINCGKGEKYICPNCLAKVKSLKPICPYCQKPSIDGMTHVKCRKKYGLDGLLTFWEYDGVIRKAILALKYKFARQIAGELSSLILTSLKSESNFYPLPSDSILIPIPMHFFRENWRGFNQSELVGKSLATAMNWGYVDNLLVKKRATVSQTELKKSERTSNLKGVFSLNPLYSKSLAKKSVLVFDDVWTTGSTLREAAKVLKHAGAEKVWGMTIAR